MTQNPSPEGNAIKEQLTNLLRVAHSHHQSGQLPQAEAAYREMLQLEPEQPDALYGLGVLAHQTAQYATAENFFTTAVTTRPDYADYRYALALSLKAQGRNDEASEHLHNLVLTEPGHIDALLNLGGIYRDQGNFRGAIEYFQKITDIQPDHDLALANLGNAFWQLEQFDIATDYFDQVANLKPEDSNAQLNLGSAYYDQGKFELAIDCYQKVMKSGGSDGLEIRIATAVPKILMSNDHINEIRNRLDENISRLLSRDLEVENPIAELRYSNFFLAYHGRNNRDLQLKLARLYEHACPSLNYTAPHCLTDYQDDDKSKIKIGFVSGHFSPQHSISKISRGIIANLSRELFSVSVFCLPNQLHGVDPFIQQHADSIVMLPHDLESARRAIEEYEQDILFYQDIGIELFTFLLAFSRLAPVQCTYFGHPDTTGIPNMDYYISTEDWDPENAKEHYSEKLVRLKDVASVAYYYKPPVSDQPKPRSYFGLSDNDHIYLCPLTLFKIHPDFDELLSGILRADPEGRLVFIEGVHPHWAELLRERFERTMSGFMDRIQFLPLQKYEDFIDLIAVSDVMLDSIHFCSFNTVLEAFAVGTPVVTLPGELMRSRYTTGFYKKMELEVGLVKSKKDYVDIAVRLGTDPAYRAGVKQQILEKNDRLWEEDEVVREFERVFREIAR